VTRTLAMAPVAVSGLTSRMLSLPSHRTVLSRLGNLDAPLLNGLSTRSMPNANRRPGLVLVDKQPAPRRRGRQMAACPLTAVGSVEGISREIECHRNRCQMRHPTLPEVGLEL